MEGREVEGVSSLAGVARDRAARTWITWGLLWLLVSVTMGVALSLGLLRPLPALVPPLAYGRLLPRHADAAVFGALGSLLVGGALYAVPRLAGAFLASEGVAVAAAWIWNLGVVGLGDVASALGRGGGGVPAYPWPLLLLGAACLAAVAVDLVVTAARGRREELPVALVYLLSGAVAGPLVLALRAAVPLFLSGVNQIVGGNYGLQALWWLWLAPLSLGLAHYLLPRLTGEPLARAPALLGAWSLVAVGAWRGGTGLLFWPVQGWLQTLGVAFGVAVLLPVVTVSALVLGGVRKGRGGAPFHPEMAFLIGGTVCFLAGGVLSALGSLPWFQSLLGLTPFGSGQDHLLLLGGFLSFGLSFLYFSMPRVFGRVWAFPGLVRVHVWMSMVGIAAVVAGFLLAGLVQGEVLLAAVRSGASMGAGKGYGAVLLAVSPFRALTLVGGLLVAGAQVILGVNVLASVFSARAVTEGPQAALEEASVAVSPAPEPR